MHCANCYHLYNLKNVKNTHGGVLLLVKLQALATLLKVTLVHGCFSRFLSCTNGTKSPNAWLSSTNDFQLQVFVKLLEQRQKPLRGISEDSAGNFCCNFLKLTFHSHLLTLLTQHYVYINIFYFCLTHFSLIFHLCILFNFFSISIFRVYRNGTLG